MRHVVALAAVLLAFPAAAAAAPLHERDYAIVEVERDPLAPSAKRVAHTIYLNRCIGDCIVSPGGNDATANRSSLVSETSTISEFMYSDTIWDGVVTCVRDVFAPYDVEIVTDEPPTSVDYVEVLVAGHPNEIGQPSTTLGYSPLASDCSANSNWISFAFANVHGTDPLPELCATVAHEAGHVYGLDHTLPCRDPMSYDQGCGVKHFLNLNMECGEFDGPRECQCDARLNTYRHLLEAMGPGTTPPPPQVTIPYPTPDLAVVDNFTIFGEVVEARIVDRVEFRLNGFPWGIEDGSLTETTYQYSTPDDLPDGIIDIEVLAFNDLQLEGSAGLMVTKGVPCTSSSTCLDAQSCNDGRCEWPPPTIDLGEECIRDDECVTFRCLSDGENSLCTKRCVVGDDTTCGDGFTCVEAGEHGTCWPSDLIDHGGCCSTSGGPGGGLLAAGVLGLLLRRRRRVTPGTDR